MIAAPLLRGCLPRVRAAASGNALELTSGAARTGLHQSGVDR
jgi:hypothetical protein